jgi:hypothetical protein
LPEFILPPPHPSVKERLPRGGLSYDQSVRFVALGQNRAAPGTLPTTVREGHQPELHLQGGGSRACAPPTVPSPFKGHRPRYAPAAACTRAVYTGLWQADAHCVLCAGRGTGRCSRPVSGCRDGSGVLARDLFLSSCTRAHTRTHFFPERP